MASLLEHRIRKLNMVKAAFVIIFFIGLILGAFYLPPPNEISDLWQVIIWSATIGFGLIYWFIERRLSKLRPQSLHP